LQHQPPQYHLIGIRENFLATRNSRTGTQNPHNSFGFDASDLSRRRSNKEPSMANQAMNRPEYKERKARQNAEGAQAWKEYQQQQRSISDKIERLRKLRLARQEDS
jgi:hypothetical protein